MGETVEEGTPYSCYCCSFIAFRRCCFTCFTILFGAADSNRLKNCVIFNYLMSASLRWMSFPQLCVQLIHI